MENHEIQREIYATFASVASALGYSEINGMIVSALFVEGKPLSLQEISKITGYSLSSISIALDLLELVGIVKKVKNLGDKKLYAKLEGDVLEGLKNAFFLKAQKAIQDTLEEFRNKKAVVKDRKTKKILETLEKEVKKLERYIQKLHEVQIPGG